MEHLIAAKPGEIQIREPVVVDIANRHAHPVAARVNPARLGDVGEVERARAVGFDFEIVAIQAVAEPGPGGGGISGVPVPSIWP